jgi:hypothetical protein
MATQTKTNAETEAATERIRELNEQILDFGRKAGMSFLDAYETTLKTFADYQDKAADSSQLPWLASMARAQANFTREISKAYTSTARELLK